jgi:ABC-type uncharacterized transport system permease subunit
MQPVGKWLLSGAYAKKPIHKTILVSLDVSIRKLFLYVSKLCVKQFVKANVGGKLRAAGENHDIRKSFYYPRYRFDHADWKLNLGPQRC